MSPTVKTDVLIVGAGPTGLSMACQLARFGVEFLVVERQEGVTHFSKAVGVHARTLEIYDQLGVAAQALDEGVVAGKMRLLEGGHVRGELDLREVGKGLSPFPFMLVLEQNKNERILYDRLRSMGGEVRWGCEMVSFSHAEFGVTAQVRQVGGAAQTVHAKYIVGCDGPKSLVRHGMGCTFEGSTFERLFYVADATLQWEFPHDALHVCLAKNSIVAFFPLKGENRYRIVGAFPEGTDREEGEVVYEEIEHRIKLEAEIALEMSNVTWFSVYKVHSRRTNKFSEGRCFLAGDAAHIHTPAGGQGMNTGIQDAYNLAWKLAFALRSGAGQPLLDSYDPERLENAKLLLESTDRLFNVMAGSDWLVNIVRTTIFPPLAGALLRIDPVRRQFFTRVSQIGIAYRDSALSVHDGDEWFHLKSGDRMPFFLIDGKSVFDLLQEPRFHLLAMTDDPDASLDAFGSLAAEYPDAIDLQTVSLDSARAAFDADERPFAVLLRPDNHIAMLSRDLSPERVRAYMHDVAGLAFASS